MKRLGATVARLLPPEARHVTIVRWALVGLLIRLAVMPFTMHLDFIAVLYFPSLFAFHGVVDLYSHLHEYYLASIESRGWFYYPPLTYYTFGILEWLLQPLTPQFQELIEVLGPMHMANTATVFSPYLLNVDSAYLMRNLFVLKVPYLICDMGIGILLLKLCSDERTRQWAFAAWMLNPVTIYSAFMAGRFEIFPAFFMVASVLAMQRLRATASSLWIGIAAAYNNIPGICVPALCVAGSSPWQSLRMATLSVLPYALLFIPLYLSSDGFVRHVIVPPLYGREVSTLAGAIALKPAILSAVLLVLYVAWAARFRQLTTRWHSAILATLLVWYIVYAWRFGLGVPLFIGLAGLIAAVAAAERDPEFGIDAAAIVWLFDASARFGFNWAMLLLIYGLLFIHSRRTGRSRSSLMAYYLVVLTAAFSFVGVSWFWFVIVTPFMALWAAEHRRARLLFVVQISALALTTLHTKYMLGDIWSPVHPAFFGGLPGLSDQFSAAAWSQVLWSARQVFRVSSWLIVAVAIAYLFQAGGLRAGVVADQQPAAS